MNLKTPAFHFAHLLVSYVPAARCSRVPPFPPAVFLLRRGGTLRPGRGSEYGQREGRGERADPVLQPDGHVLPLLAALALGGRVLQRGKSTMPKVVRVCPPPLNRRSNVVWMLQKTKLLFAPGSTGEHLRCHRFSSQDPRGDSLIPLCM